MDVWVTGKPTVAFCKAAAIGTIRRVCIGGARQKACSQERGNREPGSGMSQSLSDFLLCRVLVHLSRGGAEVQIFAPDIPQMHVVDHTKGQPSESETRCGSCPSHLAGSSLRSCVHGCFVLAVNLAAFQAVL